MTDTNRLLRREEVEELTGLSRSAIYRMMRAAEFPTPIRIGPRAVRWPKAELDEFLAQCPRATGEASKKGEIPAHTHTGRGREVPFLEAPPRDGRPALRGFLDACER